MSKIVAKEYAIKAVSESYKEGERILQICNACRYCEGFCSVFPAMTEFRTFEKQQLDYLANLCHNCRGCHYACQYADPHEFKVNVPKTLNEIRVESWQDYAWPGFMAKLFQRNGLLMCLLLALSLMIIFIYSALNNNLEGFFTARADGNYKALIPHSVMVATAAPVFLFSLFSMAISAFSFWKNLPNKGFNWRGIIDALSLKNMSGAGHGCNDDSDKYSMTRRYLHHATFYGFMLCFAATTTGTIYHYGFGWEAPHSYFSLPVMFGMVGGVLLCFGTAGLLWMKQKTEVILSSPKLKTMEVGFILMLFFTSLTGLLLLWLRETSLMGVMLCIHLAFVLTLFLILPYSKMVHGMYRLLALVCTSKPK